MENNGDIELIAYCIETMCNKEYLMELFNLKGVLYKKKDFSSYKTIVDLYKQNTDKFTLDEVRKFFRSKWESTDIEKHLNNLKSGKINGHSWHNTSPTFLHKGLQDMVRKCINGDITIDQLLSNGEDVVKHEYFIVAQHDLCESTIITKFDDVIPPIRKKSVTDFIFKGIPVDLKVSSFPKDWNGPQKDLTVSQKKELAEMLFKGADRERNRKDADKTEYGWEWNRMYIINEDESKWLSSPETKLNSIYDELNASKEFSIVIGGKNVTIFLIII